MFLETVAEGIKNFLHWDVLKHFLVAFKNWTSSFFSNTKTTGCMTFFAQENGKSWISIFTILAFDQGFEEVCNGRQIPIVTFNYILKTITHFVID